MGGTRGAGADGLPRLPSGITVPVLRGDPTWDPVREDSEFKALLADPSPRALAGVAQVKETIFNGRSGIASLAGLMEILQREMDSR